MFHHLKIKKFNKIQNLETDLKPLTIFTGSDLDFFSEFIDTFKMIRCKMSEKPGCLADHEGHMIYDLVDGNLIRLEFHLNGKSNAYQIEFEGLSMDPVVMEENLWIGGENTLSIKDGKGFIRDDNGHHAVPYTDAEGFYTLGLSRSIYFGEKPISRPLKKHLAQAGILTKNWKTVDSDYNFKFHNFKNDIPLWILEYPAKNLPIKKVPEIVEFLESLTAQKKQVIVSTFNPEFLNSLTVNRDGNLVPYIKIIYVTKTDSGYIFKDFEEMRKESPSLDGWTVDFGIGAAIYHSGILEENQ